MGKIIKAGVEHYFSGGIGSGSDIVILTQEEYDELVANNTVESGVYYFIEDVNIEGGNNVVNDASDIIYDNSASGLEADNVQGAIDEVNGKVDEISNDITELNQNLGNIYRSDIQNATSLENALSIICDKSTDKYKAYSGVMYIPYSIEPERNGWYSYRFNNIDNTVWYGIITGDTVYTFSRSAGADAVLKKLGSGEITIPKIYLYNYTHVFTAADKTEFFGGDGKANSEFKIYCEPHSSLKIGSTTASVTITCEKADGTTQNITVSSAETIDISAYKYVTFKPSLTTNIAGAYRNDTTTNASITLTDIVLS